MNSPEEKKILEIQQKLAEEILAADLEIIDSEIWDKVNSNRSKVEEILGIKDFKTIIKKKV